jgi:predicted RNase H-like HicB family nuclease
MKKKYTTIIRRSQLQYIAICLELNVSSCGDTLVEVEKNLRDAIEIYLADLKEHPETTVSPTSIEDLIEFLKDTEPQQYSLIPEEYILRPLEIHEVPAYA